MKANIKYIEIVNFLSTKFGKSVSLRPIDIDELSIAYTFTTPIPIVGSINKNFSLRVKYLGFDGPKLKVRLLNHKIVGKGLKMLAPFFSDKIADIVASLPDNIYVIDFSKIDKASAFFNEFDISSLEFYPENVNAEITYRNSIKNA